MSTTSGSPEQAPEDYSLAAVQRRLCGYIRHPENSDPPHGLEVRRLDVYRDLVFNNIESLLGGSFPVLKSTLGDAWKELIRKFLSDHVATTPYFTQLASEFYLFVRRQWSTEAVPLYVEELAHHELVELELLYRQAEGFDQSKHVVSGEGLVLSPLVDITKYAYPVHRISAKHLPEQPPEHPTFMLQFRNPEGKVVFMQLSGFAFQLLSLVSLYPGYSADHWLKCLSSAQAAPGCHRQIEHFAASGRALVEKLLAKGVLYTVAESVAS
ncbi:MAG: putative DNA-binding domain-containing protein [Rubricoccaceae bacterium]|nr:putative DNA-binding domain-containing protein [Rubricoccaceae bacterium]